MTDFSAAEWRKSSHSGDDYGQCVELAAVAGMVGVRDSKQGGTGPVLEFGRHEMASFLRAVRAGAFRR